MIAPAIAPASEIGVIGCGAPPAIGWDGPLIYAEPIRRSRYPRGTPISLAYRRGGSASAPSIRCTMKTSSMHAAWKTRAWHAISRSLAALSTDSTLSHQLLEYHVHSSTASARLYEKRSQAEA